MLNNRALSTALLAALTCAAGNGTAHAAGHPPGPGSPSDARRTSIPAQDLSLLSRAVREHRAGAVKPGPAGVLKSTNWAGYGVTGGTYTQVSANWIEPSVRCTSNGIVGFWVGLDGWGSTSVEQDGTGVDCQNGSPQQFAWWETYPSNSVQVYRAPVSAGDQLSSSIVAQGQGRYTMVLTDWTARWTIKNPAVLPAGRNASAEIVAEAVTAGNDITTLPDFGAIGFTDTTVNDRPLRSVGAQAIDMTDMANNVIATTSDDDVNGDFIVDYVGSLSSSPMRSARRLLGLV